MQAMQNSQWKMLKRLQSKSLRTSLGALIVFLTLIAFYLGGVTNGAATNGVQPGNGQVKVTYAVTAATTPEINVKGNNTTIDSGDTTPSTGDGTDFGSAAANTGANANYFTIENTGSVALNLTGTPRVALSGTNAGDFSIAVQPASPVAPTNGTTTFLVNFAPTAEGLRTATISIANDDTDEASYTFAIQGTGTPAPANGPICGNFTNKTTSDGLGAENVFDVFAEGSTVYAATANASDGGVSISTDSGSSFTTRTAGNSGLVSNTVLAVYAVGSTIYAGTSNGLSISTDGGTSFSTRTTANGLGVNYVRDVMAVGNTVYVATGSGSNGGVAISTDGGANFVNRTTADGLGSNVVFGLYVNGSAVYAATTSGLAVSTDGGLSFSNRTQALNGLGSNSVNGVYAVGNTVYAATGGGLSISTDGGLNFTTRTTANGLGSNGVQNVYVQGSTVYAATSSGISISADGGMNFTNYTTTNGLGNNLVRQVRTAGNTLYVATGAFGVGGLAICTASAGPAINVKGNNMTIANGDTTPSTGDGTDFGSAAVNTGANTGDFTIENTGSVALNLTGTPRVALSGANAGDFSITVQPASPVAATNGTTMFQITFDPSASGTRTATVSIANDDTAKTPYTFAIQGTGSHNPPVVTPQTPTAAAGSPATPRLLALVSDDLTPATQLTATINSGTNAMVNGVTVSGLTINASGQLLGNVATTCAAATAMFTLNVTDGSGSTTNATLTVMVTSNTPPTLGYGNQAFPPGTTPSFGPATGPSDNGTVTNIALQSITPAAGLTLNVNTATGQVTVTSATIAQTYTVVIRATDDCGAMTDATFTVAPSCPTIALSPASLPNATLNTAYPQTITASPAGGNYSFALTSGLLPAGLTLNSNGSFSGAPTQNGTFNFRVTANGFGGCSAFADYTLLVNCQTITVSPTSLPGGTIGTSYNQSVSASPAGTYSYAVSSGALPPGLSLNAASGAITGTPTAGGSFNFTITASQGGCSGSQSYSVTIGCAAITFNPASPLTAGQAGVAYNQTITASPAPSVGSYTYSVTLGSLPSGLTLNTATGVVSGTPNATGNFTFTIQALATGGCAASQSYTLAIVCPTVTLSPATLPNASTGTTYSQTLSAAPAGGNYTYAVTTGSLPTGLNLNSSTGVISGTPTVANSFTFRVTASGFGGCTGFRDYTVTVGGGGCPTITLPASLPNGTIGGLYSNSAAASPAGSYSYAVTSGAVPPGTTLFTGFGLLFGFPTAAGSYTFTVTATQGACTGSQSYTVLVSAGFASALSVASDFDGDLKSDLSIFRADGNWEVSASRDGKTQTTLWGAPYAPYNDLVVSGDYDGDGKTDPAVFRRGTEYAGYWFIKKSSDGEWKHYFWGLPTDTPTPGDYDGDGKTDAAVWRASDGVWYIIRSSDGGIRTIHWGSGTQGDVAVPGDYDGDGKTDAAVFRKSNGHWYVKRSSDGTTLDVHWGLGTDVPVPGDYDGDAKTDYAVWRASEGAWYWVESDSAAVKTVTLGAAGDVPVPTDYDGDGKADAAVWQAATGNWQIQRSSDGKTVSRTYGRSGDTPVPARRN